MLTHSCPSTLTGPGSFAIFTAGFMALSLLAMLTHQFLLSHLASKLDNNTLTHAQIANLQLNVVVPYVNFFGLFGRTLAVSDVEGAFGLREHAEFGPVHRHYHNVSICCCQLIVYLKCQNALS